MPPAKKFLICTIHREGPLDVWYDCSQCCPGSKEESLGRLQWMTRKEIKGWPQHAPEMLRNIDKFFVSRATNRNK